MYLELDIETWYLVANNNQNIKYDVSKLFFSLLQTACKHNVSIEEKTVCYKTNQQQKKLINIWNVRRQTKITS